MAYLYNNEHIIGGTIPPDNKTIILNDSNRLEVADIFSLYPKNASTHNSIFRGKNLGNSFTAEQKQMIANGTFDDIWVGDYWVINGVTWRVAHLDYWLGTGDTECTTHHAVIVPDTSLYNAQMNTTNTTTGAYVGSDMYKTNLAQAKTIINNAFGISNVLIHREYLANAIKNTSDPTYESSVGWYNSTVELMCGNMVFGTDILHNVEANGVVPASYTIDKSQFTLFRINTQSICNRTSFWLRDVSSATTFTLVYFEGIATSGPSASAIGVRPCFAIKG